MLAQLPQSRNDRVGSRAPINQPLTTPVHRVRKFTEFKELLRDDAIGHAPRCFEHVEHTFDDIIENREWK